MRYVVTPLEYKSVTSFVHKQESYDLSSVPNGKIKKLAIWFLKKIGAKNLIERVSNETFISIDTEDPDLITVAMEAALSVYSQVGDMPKVLLVGRDEQKRLIRQSLSHQTSIYVEGSLSLNGQHYIHGMTLVLVPWMEGLLPMLSLNDLKVID